MKIVTKSVIFIALITLAALAKDPFGPDGFGGGSPTESVANVELISGKLIVTNKKVMVYYWPEGVQQTTRMWKDVYCASNGTIVLESQILANVQPAHTTPERVDWPTNQ